MPRVTHRPAAPRDVSGERVQRTTCLQRHPPATHRKNLADKTVGGVPAKISGKCRAFCGTRQPPEWHLALKSFLEARIGLNLGGEIHRVLDEVLRDRIHLNVVQRHFDANRLNIDQLGPACRAAGGRALHAAQCRGTAHDQNLASPRSIICGKTARNSLGQGSTSAAKVSRHSESDASVAREVGAKIGEVHHQDIHDTRRVDDGICRPDVGERIGVGDDNGTLPRKDLAKCRAHEGAGVRDENAPIRKDVVHGRALSQRAKLADDRMNEATTCLTAADSAGESVRAP